MLSNFLPAMLKLSRPGRFRFGYYAGLEGPMRRFVIVTLVALAWLLAHQSPHASAQARLRQVVRAQSVWSDSGPGTSDGFELGVSRSGRAKIRFALERDRVIAVEGNAFVVFARAKGLRIASETVTTISPTAVPGRQQADSLAIWLIPSVGTGYEASWNTGEVRWRDGEQPPKDKLAADTRGTESRWSLSNSGPTVAPALRIELCGTDCVRIRFAFSSDDGTPTTVAAAAFSIAGGRDGVRVRSLAAASITTPLATMTVRAIELWLADGGGVGYRAIQ
jgi:hypothetical protein